MGNQNKGFFKELKKALKNSGDVVYTFVHPRYDIKTGKNYVNKSYLRAPINRRVLEKTLRNGQVGSKSLPEILKVFKQTQLDMGASSFHIES